MDITDLNDYNNSYNSDLNEKAVLIGMIFLSVLLLLFVAFYICFTCIRSRHRNSVHRITVDFTANPDHDDDHANFSNGPCNIGLNTTIIALLPIYTITKKTTTDGDFPMVDCVVCLCALKEGENAKLLPNCKHLFHVDCIDKWLKLGSTCPLCRTEVKPKPSFRLQSQDREGHVGISFDALNSHFDFDDEASKDSSFSQLMTSFLLRRTLGRETSSIRIQSSSHHHRDDVDRDLERQ